MMKTVRRYFDAAFPFLAVLALWRLSSPLWNPGGALCVIPIFYYSLIRPRGEFLPMAVVGCMLLDYNFDTLLFWTVAFCAACAANWLQNHIDLTRQKADGIYVFMAFFGLCLGVLGIHSAIAAASFRPLAQIIWLFLWTVVLYIPFVKLSSAISRQ